MMSSNKKFELSPRLKLGVGRGYSQNQILKFSAIFCLILAAILLVHTGYIIIHPSKTVETEGQVLGATDIKDPKPTAILDYKTYTVLKGDTLFNISQKFNIDWNTLVVINNLKNPFILKPGQTLNIPK